MNLKRIFTLLAVLIFSFSIIVQIEFASFNPNPPIYSKDTLTVLSDILYLLFIAIAGSAILTVWMVITFKLLDNGTWYIELIGVIISGVIGCVFLLVARWIYHKSGFKFLS
jgi:hypothetical protein